MMEQDADGLVEKLEALRCNKSDCRPIAHEVHEETLDKAISIVRQHRSKEREALEVAREILERITHLKETIDAQGAFYAGDNVRPVIKRSEEALAKIDAVMKG